jgi:hypothetical protein
MCPDCGGLLWDPEVGETSGVTVGVDCVRTFGITLECAECDATIATSTTRILWCASGRVDYQLAAAS